MYENILTPQKQNKFKNLPIVLFLNGFLNDSQNQLAKLILALLLL